MKLPGYVVEAIRRLEAEGHEAYVVGGAVRDELLGRRPKDYDLCTGARPEQIEEIFSDCTLAKQGARFGSIFVKIGAHSLDITTFRADNSYSDARRPDSVRFGISLHEDLARRDFTINAIAYNPKTGIADPFGGQADLQARVIRSVGDPTERFSQDALRILRALRFSARLEFTIDPETALAARALRSSLHKLAVERVRDELSGFIVCKDAGLLLLRYRDIIFEVIPELRDCDGFNQKNPNHHLDVLGHIAETVNRAPAELHIRLAALFHDIGKPRCLVVDNTGRGRFPGHMEESAVMARAIMKRLHYPGRLIDTVAALVENHDKPYASTPTSARQWLHKLGSRNVFLLIKLKRADCLAHDTTYHNRLYRIAGFRREVTAALRRGDCYSLSSLAVNGRDIVRELDLPPGVKTGEILDYLLALVIEGAAENNRRELLELAREYNLKGNNT